MGAKREIGRGSGEARVVGVGFLGCGVVGAAAARILVEHAEHLELRFGTRIEIARVAVHDPSKRRRVQLPASVWTTDPFQVVEDPNVQVVVEVMGGIEPARELILAALKAGKHVVTANKDLLSGAGHELMQVAEQQGLELLFEAAVGGGIPIIRPIKESLAGDRIRRVMGIVNGTTNFILTRMSETGDSFAEALEAAAHLGYTELDPTADIGGHDAAAKLAILTSLAFNTRVLGADVHREGIARVTPSDIRAAHELGYEVKLLAVAEEHDGEISASVHPAMLPRTHPLAAVRDVFNAVFLEGERSGELMFFGRGAGGDPTGAAVVSDIVEVARNIMAGGAAARSTGYGERARIRDRLLAPARYYVVLSVADQPGVLAAVAGVFAAHDVSIASVRQEGRGDEATLVLITHTSSVGRHEETFEELQRLAVVKSLDSKMRVQGTAEGP